MRLVRDHTDIPVPEVGSSYYNANEGRLCMSFIQESRSIILGIM
jgi:hypothetical protein